jgi:hypothetical protein
MRAILNDPTFTTWIWVAVIVALGWNAFPSLLTRRLLVRFSSSEMPQILKGWLIMALVTLTIWVAIARGWRAGLFCLGLWLGAAFVGHLLNRALQPFAIRRLTDEDIEAIRAERERRKI